MVQENQILLQAILPSLDIISIPIAETFNISPALALKKLCVRPGDQVRKGQPLAICRRWFSRRKIEAPIDAYVSKYDRGILYLYKQREPLTVSSELPGVVASISQENCVSIETRVALISGAWQRNLASGELVLASSLPGRYMLPTDVVEEQKGALLVGGCLADREIIKRAQTFHLAGIIASSMPAGLVQDVEKYDLPLLLITGIGEHTLTDPLLKMLQEREGMHAFIGAAPPFSDHAIIIPLDQATSTSAIEPRYELRPGTLVRILRGQHHGETATIIAQGKQRLAIHNSTVVAGAEVRLSSGRITFLPEANLQIIYDRNGN